MFATDSVTAPDRLRFWNGLADRFFQGTRIGAPGADFQARLARSRVAGLTLTRLTSGQSIVDRAPPAGGEGNLVLHLQLRGRARHIQRGIEIALSPCDRLSPAAIARECGVSLRTLQAMFAARGTTPSAYLLERRLLRAADRIIADRPGSITQIAFDPGFNDSSYFSRCFRRRFGLSPRAWREARGGDGPPLRADPSNLRRGPSAIPARRVKQG